MKKLRKILHKSYYVNNIIFIYQIISSEVAGGYRLAKVKPLIVIKQVYRHCVLGNEFI
jgi:hypothetical protein